MPSTNSTYETAPWKHTTEAAWIHRRNKLNHPRVEPLSKLVAALRNETNLHIPWVDPFCGGVEARILLILKRPGRLGASASDFLSLANADVTARNTREALEKSGIQYGDLVFWNAIPWSGDRDENVTAAMLIRGGAMLQRLLPCLPKLRAVLLMGNEAGKVEGNVRWPKHVRRLSCAHPGPFVWNQLRYRSQKEAVFEAFRQATLS